MRKKHINKKTVSNRTMAKAKQSSFNQIIKSRMFFLFGWIAVLYSIFMERNCDIANIKETKLYLSIISSLLFILYARKKHKTDWDDSIWGTLFLGSYVYAILISINCFYMYFVQPPVHNFDSTIKKAYSASRHYHNYVPAFFSFTLNDEDIELYTSDNEYEMISNDLKKGEVHISGQYSNGLFSTIKIHNYKTYTSTPKHK